MAFANPNPVLTIAILIVLAYMLGSVPVGILVGRARGFDPRTVGSGNIGMTNVGRAGGKVAAAITFLGDMAKGLVPVLIGRQFHLPPVLLAVVGLAAFLGSVFSLFLHFHGGRGVSTSLGVWLGLAPAPIGVVALVFILIFAATRVVSLSSIGAAIALPPAVAGFGSPRPFILLAIVMTALVLLRHRENIQRLARGEEPSVGSKGRRRAG